jgi:putative ABC transport system permease protein
MVRAPSSDLMSFSGTSISQKVPAELAKLPHVAMATGVVNQSSGSNLFDSVAGVDPVAFQAMSGPFVFDEGHVFQQDNDIIIDTYEAQQLKKHVGDKLNILGNEWNISGIYEPGKLAHSITRMDVLQKVSSNTGKVSVVYLKADDPANVDTVMKELEDNPKLQGYKIYRMSDLTTLMNPNNVAPLRIFIRVVIGIAVIIGFAVTSLSMYMAILQRTREIGILKSLGGSSPFIMRLILVEAVILGVGGTLVGIILSFFTRWMLSVFVPASMPQAITPDWWAYAGLIALAAAVLGGLYPGIIAVRLDPIEALAYE